MQTSSVEVGRIRTPAGAVAWRRDGGSGETVVLLPGATLGAWIWEPLAERLAGGNRVLRYDLFGRGGSDRPRGPYDLALFRGQLEQLLLGLGEVRGLHLVGSALGGLIAVDFAVAHPSRVASLALVEPDGLGTRLPASARLARLPIAGEILFALGGRATLARRLPAYFRDPARAAALAARLDADAASPGFGRALLSILRSMPIDGSAPLYASLGALRIPTLLLWGEDDRITPRSVAERAARLVPGASLSVVGGSGHLPHVERPDETALLLRDFWRSGRPGLSGSA
jgi:pimeloyl-ACP methyl ester carboxylesterase